MLRADGLDVTAEPWWRPMLSRSLLHRPNTAIRQQRAISGFSRPRTSKGVIAAAVSAVQCLDLQRPGAFDHRWCYPERRTGDTQREEPSANWTIGFSDQRWNGNRFQMDAYSDAR